MEFPGAGVERAPEKDTVSRTLSPLTAVSFLAAKTINGPKFCSKRYFLPKRLISRRLSPKIYNISIWCMRISQNLGFGPPFGPPLGPPFPNFFSCPSPLLSLPFALHILSGCRKQLGRFIIVSKFR